MQMLLGVFSDTQHAEQAVNELEQKGYNPKDISVVMKDTSAAREVSSNTGASVAEGAVSGAATGGLIGALAGLLVGVGAITIPGIGALLIGGPLAAALGLGGAAATTVSGAATGAVAGGLVGALVGLGVPEEEARVYEERLKSGAVLLAVPTRVGEEGQAREILERHFADNIRAVNT